MRNYLFLFLFVFFNYISAIGQEMSVKSFAEVKGDQTAHISNVKDNNGSICSLVYIYVDELNVSIEGTYCVKVVPNNHYYEVFLAGGAKSFTLKHENYLPLTVSCIDYDIKSLKSGDVYRLDLLCDKTEKPSHLSDIAKNNENDANAGDALAQYRLGKAYYHGINTNGIPDYEKAFEFFMKSALQGNKEAQYNLGICYQFGQGVEKDVVQSAKWFEKAASQGHSMAQFKYASALHFGSGIKANVNDAIVWYKRAIENNNLYAKNNLATLFLFYDPTNSEMGASEKKELGFPEHYEEGIKYLQECEAAGIASSYLNLGIAYFYGVAVKKDPEKSKYYYEKAIATGEFRGLYNLGMLYMNGEGVKKDEKKAISYWEQSAQKGLVDAYHSLGVCYYQGTGKKQDFKKAAEYFQLASDLGDTNSKCNLGNMYLNGIGVSKDNKKAFKLFSEAAELGDFNGYTNVGVMYQQGLGVEEPNITKAIEFYEKAAEAGNLSALTNLAILYQEGQGVPCDIEKALSYYNRAIKYDQTGAAAYNLGVLYHNGKKGVLDPNYQRAFELYQQSAEENYAPAQYNLGYMYLNGQYVKKDVKMGMKYIKMSADQDYELAKNYLKANKQAKFNNFLNGLSEAVTVR